MDILRLIQVHIVDPCSLQFNRLQIVRRGEYTGHCLGRPPPSGPGGGGRQNFILTRIESGKYFIKLTDNGETWEDI